MMPSAAAPAPPYHVISAVGEQTPLEIPEETLIQAYKNHGALLLRGFSLDMDIFRRLTQRYCGSSILNGSPGRELLDRQHNIQTVNIGHEAFPLHPELSREPWKPDICFFWCMRPPGRGGETTVCDGVEIVRKLPAVVRDALMSRRLQYRQPATTAECIYWLGSPEPDDSLLSAPPAGCPYTFSRFDGGILRSFTRPALHTPMFANELAFGNFLLFGRYLKGIRRFPMFEDGDIVPDGLLDEVKRVSDQLTAPVEWQENDVIILDNTRFMHGRRPIIDTAERRIATHFGFVRFARPDPEEGNDPVWRRADFSAP